MARDITEQPAPRLDDIDRAILAELTGNGRASVTAVAEAVHISRAHAYSRIARLTETGVLSRFTAVVDPVKAGGNCVSSCAPFQKSTTLHWWAAPST